MIAPALAVSVEFPKGGWPIVRVGTASPLEFDDLRALPLSTWHALSDKDQSAITRHLAKAGRLIRVKDEITDKGTVETRVVHLPKFKGAVIGEGSGFGYWVRIEDPANRHNDDIEIHVSNANSQADAESMVREWIEDVIGHELEDEEQEDADDDEVPPASLPVHDGTFFRLTIDPVNGKTISARQSA